MTFLPTTSFMHACMHAFVNQKIYDKVSSSKNHQSFLQLQRWSSHWTPVSFQEQANLQALYQQKEHTFLCPWWELLFSLHLFADIYFVFKYFSRLKCHFRKGAFVKINYCKYKYVQYFIYIAKTLDIHTFTNSKRSQRPVKIASRAAYYQIKVNQDRRSGTSSFSYGSHKIKCFETF